MAVGEEQEDGNVDIHPCLSYFIQGSDLAKLTVTPTPLVLVLGSGLSNMALVRALIKKIVIRVTTLEL